MIRFRDCEFQDSSYPCDYKDGGELPDCNLCHKIRIAGIKEVVEWMFQKSNKTLTQAGIFQIIVLNKDLQAKLKEWGIVALYLGN